MTKRYYSVVFMQGDEAYDVIDNYISEDLDKAIAYLSNWDYGGETRDAAQFNGHTYNKVPDYPNQRSYSGGHYVMTWNVYDGGSVALYAPYDSDLAE